MRNYQNMVFTTATRLLGNPTDAEDIAQTVFLKAYEHYDEIAQSPTAGGWLKKVTTNLCLNHISRYRSRQRLFSEMQSEEGSGTFDIPVPETIRENLNGADRRQILEEALQKLPSEHRAPLALYHFEDMSYEEIAAQLHVSLSKIKTDIHRARETLRRRLQSGRKK